MRAVVILDVLRYLDYSARATCYGGWGHTGPVGVLLMRVGDATAASVKDLPLGRYLGEFHPRPSASVFCRSLQDWQTSLCRLGFTVEPLPMNRGTPFANALLVARLGSAG